jgi:hypothetical protein
MISITLLSAHLSGNAVLFACQKNRAEGTVTRTDEIADIQTQIKDLETRLAGLEERLPAHSIPSQLISEMDELDEQIGVMKRRLAAILSAKESTGDMQGKK